MPSSRKTPANQHSHSQKQALQHQAFLLREQAHLLDLIDEAVMIRDEDDVITCWNRGAEIIYGFSRGEAIGCHSHALLRTEMLVPIDLVKNQMETRGFWQGELIRVSKAGKKLTLTSRWTVETDERGARRCLESSHNISRRVQMGRVIRETQENYRLLVETSTEFAMIVTDADGIIVNWNIGAEKILGLCAKEVIGQPISSIFTPEDRSLGRPWHELEKAKQIGRVEDMRWHVRKDGSRFWANGVVMPLWDQDGSLRGFTKIMRDQTGQRMTEEQNHFLANHDALTGLPNRALFSDQLHQAFVASDRSKMPLALLMLDLDQFKYVNDTFGHHTGDLLLKEVARRLQSSLRETDFIARLGGDEFVVIQTGAEQPHAAAVLAQKLIDELGRSYHLDCGEVTSGASIGIGVYPTNARDMMDLMKRADLALYSAKRKGRGVYDFYTPDLSAGEKPLKNRGGELGQPLTEQEFQLHYQPQIDLNSWTIVSAEALLRWRDDGTVPHDILNGGDDPEAAARIGERILLSACRQAKQWQSRGMPGLKIAVNCSAVQFDDAEFGERIGRVLDETGFSGSFLELEIAESVLAKPLALRQFPRLRRLGVRIVIDNYGMGTTAIGLLTNLEIDGLKIDRGLLRHAPYRHRDSALVLSIITLARNLGITVSGCGVETLEQLAYLKSNACHRAQGFIFDPPMALEAFEELMLSGHWSRINPFPNDLR